MSRGKDWPAYVHFSAPLRRSQWMARVGLSLGVAAVSAAVLTNSGAGNGHIETVATQQLTQQLTLPRVVVVGKREPVGASPDMASAAPKAADIQFANHTPANYKSVNPNP